MGIGKQIWLHLPVVVLKVNHVWKKEVPVVLDEDKNDDLPPPNATADDAFDTVLETGTNIDITK